MSIEDLMNKDAVLIHRTEGTMTDELGNEIPAEVEIDTICEVQLSDAVEPGGAGEASVTTWMIYLPTGTDARTGDTLRVAEYGEFEFVGDTWDARQGSQDMWHVEGRAKQTEHAEEGAS